ncbi:MAG: DUF3656 domain-containing protein, partial [Deltaproteobacteria bacterium]|nr:DUF3656 domain-containing protein [Kofleriaceae bacterium]
VRAVVPATAASVERVSGSVLAAARGEGLNDALLRDKLGSFGGTRYHLASLDTAALGPALHLPVSELKALRRAIVEALDAALDAPPARRLAEGPQVDRVRNAVSVNVDVDVDLDGDGDVDVSATVDAATVIPLCRTDAQLDALLAAGAPEVELDWMELVGLSRAVARARSAGARVILATPRILKPGEEKILAHLVKLEPDAILVRCWAALASLAQLAPAVPLHGDFSLNVTNSITAAFVLAQRGLRTATVAHDLDHAQLVALLAASTPARLAVTVHHHIPTFHTEHCVYAHLLSAGADFRTCGRPCEQHEVSLRDRTALVHPVVVDIGCRNTVFNAQAQSAAALVPQLLALGVRRLRLELVRETAAETTRLHAAYRALVAGETTPAEVVRAARVHEQFGVTRGTMRTLPVLPDRP